MEVILLQDVKNVGKKGETKTVADGYGMNFLIKKGLAVKKTTESMANLEKEKAAEAARQAELKKLAEENKAKLESITVEFKAKAGKGGQMIGEVSPKEVEKELKDKFNIEIDKRKVVDKVKINAFGNTYLNVELYKGVVAKIKVHVSEEK